MAGFVPPRYPAPVWARSRRSARSIAADVSFVASGVFLALLLVGVFG